MTGRKPNGLVLKARPILTAYLPQEAKEVRSAIRRRTLADASAGGDLESGMEARQIVALVVMCPASGDACAQRGQRLRSVKRLDQDDLVHADDEGVRRRVEVQAYEVGDLLLEMTIPAELVGLEPVWLQVMDLLGPTDRGMGPAVLLGQFSGVPLVQNLGESLASQHDEISGLRR